MVPLQAPLDREEQSIMADQSTFGNAGQSLAEAGAQVRDRAQEAGAQVRDRAQAMVRQGA